MNTERILHIADLIEKLEPQQFDVDDWTAITPAHAAQTLRKLAATGEVDWSHVV